MEWYYVYWHWQTRRAGLSASAELLAEQGSSPDHRAFDGCIVRTSIALPFIGRFRRGLQHFFQKGFFFQMRYLVRISIASRRHNFREIAVQNCENPPKIGGKVFCAPLRIDSWGIWKKSYCSSLGPILQMCTFSEPFLAYFHEVWHLLLALYSDLRKKNCIGAHLHSRR